MTNLLDWPEGIVYLIQYSDEPIYKIGRTKNWSTRLWEIKTSLPYPVNPIHTILTNDDVWLEKYWHNRFAAKRRWGSGVKRASEWFNLSEAEVAEFSQRDVMNPEDGELFRYLKSQEEAEEQQLLNQRSLREAAILRVLAYVDRLTQQYPMRAMEMAKSCEYQINQLENKVSRMMEKDSSEEQAIQIWEKDALRAADAKIRDILDLPLFKPL